MVKTTFTFGQRGGFLIECDSRRMAHSLPPALQQHYDSDVVEETYCVALGTGNSFVATYKGTDGMQHLQCDGVPAQLSKWLYERDSSGVLVRELNDLCVTLGPYNNSWYAFDGKSYIGFGLPQGLKAALQKRKASNGNFKAGEAPRLVCLGVNEQYAMIDERHGGSWKLSDYPGAEAFFQMLRDKECLLRPIVNMTLNAYRLNHYVMHGETGLVVHEGGTALMENSVEAISSDVMSDTRREKDMEALVEANQAALREQRLMQEALLQQLKYQQRANMAIAAASMVTAFADLSMMSNMNSGY